MASRKKGKPPRDVTEIDGVPGAIIDPTIVLSPELGGEGG